MSLKMSQAWLTRDAFDRVKCELAALINERHAADDDDAQMRRKLRIRQLQELNRHQVGTRVTRPGGSLPAAGST